MYKNCVNTIKLLAKLFPWFGVVVFAAILPIIECIDMRYLMVGTIPTLVILSIILGAIGFGGGYLFGSFIYGFVEIVENTKHKSEE